MRSEIQSKRDIENVVIISLDCVRPEALGCYPQRFPWHVRVPRCARTPNIDRLRAAGHRFDEAITHAPFTPAAHASVFTGLTPPEHGIRTLLGTRLRDDVPTLAEILSAAGWQCGAVVGSHALSHEYGLSRGFHYYDDEIDTGIKNWVLGERREAIDVTDRAISWLRSLGSQTPFFLFVHYFDAHDLSPQSEGAAPERADGHSLSGNYRRAFPEWAKTALRPAVRAVRSAGRSVAQTADASWRQGLAYFELGKQRYKSYGRRYQLDQVAKIDVQIGRLCDALADQARIDRTLIVILADHGDDFMEHGEPTHRQFLYDTTLRVPLIVYPRLGPRLIVEDQVRLADIFPTVLEVLGLRLENEIHGKSLMELLQTPRPTRTGSWDRRSFSETVTEAVGSSAYQSAIATCYASLRLPPWKLIWDRLQDKYELYRLDVDPGERHDLAGDNPELVKQLSVELRALAQAVPVRTESSSDVVIERLKGLGYL